MADTDSSPSSSSSIFSLKNSRLPDDTVFFSVFPDFSISPSPNSTTAELSSHLQSLHIQILRFLSPHTSDYIWQHEPFTLSISSPNTSCFCSSSPCIPHLHGKLRYGDNLEDEWFVVFLIFEVSRQFPNLSIRVWDTDGEFLLIEAAFHLPRWVNPTNSTNRVFIRRGNLHIIPKSHSPSTPTLLNSLSFIVNSEDKSVVESPVQLSIQNRIKDYPERANENIHKVRARVPVTVAQVLMHEPCLISLAVEGFYDRDIDSMKYAAKMERFLPNGSGEEFVEVLVGITRAMYGQLVQQTFQAPKCYPMPARSEGEVYVEAEIGMKIACGFEMIYQLRKRDKVEGKGSTWEAFRESLERSGYFKGLLPGSKDYQRLMENAEEYYRSSSLHSRASEMMSAPVKRIDDILALPYSANDFRGQALPPSDDDSWLYSGEDELNAALVEREKEMERYNMERKKKHKSKDQPDADLLSGPNLDDYGLGEIAKSMQSFMDKISSYEGAEIPQNRNLKDVDLDVDCFMKDLESVMKHPGSEGSDSDVDIEDICYSDMDSDDSDESDITEPETDKKGEDSFMSTYSDALSEELKTTTLNKSFVRANERAIKKDVQGTSNAAAAGGDMDEEFTPVDVDVNLVKSFLDSFSSQEGLSGPATNLLGLMGLQLPHDAKKDK